MQATLLVFAKPPRMGSAKTRLTRDIGATHAKRINRYCHERTIRASTNGNWAPLLCIAPDKDLHTNVGLLWPRTIPRKAQGNGNLGDRLARAFKAAPPGPVIVIGTDAPDICQTHIKTAFNSLKTNDVVFGPAEDGGFWLFGTSHQFRRNSLSFSPVRWSSKYAMGDLIKTLPTTARIKLIHRLIDLDDADSLSQWQSRQRL